jgi:hypothetical protein
LQKVGWKTSLPSLSETTNWWLKKWVSRGTGDLFRARIETLLLVRNSWTGLVRVEFDYVTEQWSDLDQQWNWR